MKEFLSLKGVAYVERDISSDERALAELSELGYLTTPVITINGNNPAHIQIGDTYSDLGAIITAPETDLNLGIHVTVNSEQGTVNSEFNSPSEITLDTSTADTFTITYHATDNAGNTGTATRTVIVVDVARAPLATSTPPASPAPDATSTSIATEQSI